MAARVPLSDLLLSTAVTAQQLFGGEFALLRAEVADASRSALLAAAIVACAVGAALFGAAFVLMTAVLGLIAAGQPPWEATGIVGVALLAGALIAALAAKSRIEAISLTPRRTIEQLERDFAAIKRGWTHG